MLTWCFLEPPGRVKALNSRLHHISLGPALCTLNIYKSSFCDIYISRNFYIEQSSMFFSVILCNRPTQRRVSLLNGTIILSFILIRFFLRIFNLKVVCGFVCSVSLSHFVKPPSRFECLYLHYTSKVMQVETCITLLH